MAINEIVNLIATKTLFMNGSGGGHFISMTSFSLVGLRLPDSGMEEGGFQLTQSLKDQIFCSCPFFACILIEDYFSIVKRGHHVGRHLKK